MYPVRHPMKIQHFYINHNKKKSDGYAIVCNQLVQMGNIYCVFYLTTLQLGHRIQCLIEHLKFKSLVVGIFYIQMYVQEIQQSYSCVLCVYILSLSTMFPLDFETVPTVW
jgi:hypothetical protein